MFRVNFVIFFIQQILDIGTQPVDEGNLHEYQWFRRHLIMKKSKAEAI